MFLIDLHFGQEHATVVGGDTEDMIIVVQNCTCNLIKKDQQSLSFCVAQYYTPCSIRVFQVLELNIQCCQINYTSNLNFPVFTLLIF